ncbi:MAG TPA: FtsX-like permease family protein, partial [Rugosimonospora sp.]|nr:FtsX-like permease family protein [Rugosimonospora sp.]
MTGAAGRRIPPHLVLGSWRDLSTVATVAALVGAYATTLILVAAIAAGLSTSAGVLGVLLGSVAIVFILIALYVSAVVMSNAVATVLAGRQRSLALLRLLGADARGLRRQIVRQSGAVALTGAVAGTLLGTVVVLVTRVVMAAHGTIPQRSYPLVSWWQIAAVAAIVAVTLVATSAGCRTVLTIGPA